MLCQLFRETLPILPAARKSLRAGVQELPASQPVAIVSWCQNPWLSGLNAPFLRHIVFGCEDLAVRGLAETASSWTFQSQGCRQKPGGVPIIIISSGFSWFKLAYSAGLDLILAHHHSPSPVIWKDLNLLEKWHQQNWGFAHDAKFLCQELFGPWRKLRVFLWQLRSRLDMPGFSQFFLEWLVFCIDFPLKGPVDPTIQTCLRDVENADFGLPKLVSLDLRWKVPEWWSLGRNQCLCVSQLWWIDPFMPS